MSKEALDSYDYRILALLQENASLSATAVAEAVNLSLNACWRRIRRLETDGYILKRVTLLDPGLLGSPIVVFVMIRTSEHSNEWLEKFSSVVQEIPEIMEIYRMSGDVDYLIKIRVSDISSYDQVYKRLIAGVKLTDVSSSFAMEMIKFTTSIPIPVH